MADIADTNIKFLKGVGESRARDLGSELDIFTFRDLLYTFPFRYVDKSRFYKISEFTGEMPAVQVRGRFISFELEGEGVRTRLKGLFSDGERLMEVVWFSRVKQLKDAYRPGVDYVIFGKPTLYRGVYSMAHPEVSAYNPQNPPTGFEGVYSVSEKMRKKGMVSRTISGLIKNLFQSFPPEKFNDPLPREILNEYNLMPFGEAMRVLHFPNNPDLLKRARVRMKFEELFYLQLNILRFARERQADIRGYAFPRIGEFFNRFFYECLPFDLTGAQKRVLREIRDDMRTGKQMNRLLQGDVGSGKTMVAFMTLLMAVDNECQGALMAPTEILAGQHYETIKKWCDAIGLKAALLTGSTRSARRREILEGIASGDIHILIGTHALIEDRVVFKQLGVAVIDEQHRFGVAQRARMWKKNSVAPHVLVMTATPIPRTLALTVYGDLDVSVIDELPPGRKPVDTLLRYDDSRMEVYRLVGRELRAGHQVYIVYPLVHENPKLELKSVEQGVERIRGIFENTSVVCVHGQMKPEEKEKQMEAFVKGEAGIMVATTVIEVGVNVPNASVMIIENAERFGLSQLHQLRGRVGRGADKSYCILMTHNNIGGDTRKRLSIMTETSDGFLISEADMKMRGPGDMEGTQQSGLAFNLKIANLAADGQILTIARRAAESVLNAHPELSKADRVVNKGEVAPLFLANDSVATIKREIERRFARTFDWSRIS